MQNKGMFHQLITGTQTGVASSKLNLILSMPTGNYVPKKINLKKDS